MVAGTDAHGEATVATAPATGYEHDQEEYFPVPSPQSPILSAQFQAQSESLSLSSVHIVQIVGNY